MTHTSREQLLLEHRFLACKDLYRSLYQRISEGMRRNYRSLSMFEHNLLDRSFFKREKMGRGEMGGKQERGHHLKTDNDRRKRMMHKECMQHLKLHKE